MNTKLGPKVPTQRALKVWESTLSQLEGLDTKQVWLEQGMIGQPLNSVATPRVDVQCGLQNQFKIYREKGPVLSNALPSCQPSTSCTSVSGTHGIVVPWKHVRATCHSSGLKKTQQVPSWWSLLNCQWKGGETHSDLGRSYLAAWEPRMCCLEFWNHVQKSGIDSMGLA